MSRLVNIKPVKKLLSSFLCLVLCALCLVPLASASWFNQTPDEFAKKINDSPENEVFGEKYTVAQLNWIVNGLHYLLTNTDNSGEFIKSLQEIKDALPQGKIPSFGTFARMGLPGFMAGALIHTYASPPASGVEYVAQTLDKLQLVPSAYAQAQAGGYGFNNLLGIQKLWQASRDMSMFLVVLLTVISGFFIIFRIKISPQTVISIQTLIPKLAVTLIAIYFSYAIAGFIVDLTYIAVSFFVSMLSFSGVIPATSLPQKIAWFTYPGFVLPTLYFLVPWLLLFILSAILLPTGILAAIAAGATAATGVGVIVSAGLTLTSAILSVSGFLIGLLSLILIIWLAWLLFQIWWMMAKSYVTFMFLIILGPWQILLGLIPGQKGFSDWFRSILAEASVFVVVPIMLCLVMLMWPNPILKYINDTVVAGNVGNIALQQFNLNAFIDLINPLKDANPGITNSPNSFPNFPLFGSTGGLIQLMFGFIVLALIPKAAEMIKDALKVPAFKYANAFTQSLGPLRQAPRMAEGAGIYQVQQHEAGVRSAGTPATANYTSTVGNILRAFGRMK